MPGFTTHHIFGFQAVNQLQENKLKQRIRRCPAAFSLGLQGPDLFFYYLPSYLLHKNNIGSVAHIESTGTFLHYLLQSRKLCSSNREYQIACAYISGFCGHYILDTNCHPYVYFRTHYEKKDHRYYGRHMNLEADLDAELLKHFRHNLPSGFRQHDKIHVTSEERRVISKILFYCYKKTYPLLRLPAYHMDLAIRFIHMGTRFLADPNGKKKVLIRKLEKWLPGYPILSPMIPHDHMRFYKDPLNLKHHIWHNPWNPSLVSTASFPELFRQAGDGYQALLLQLDHLFALPFPSRTETKEARSLCESLGNLSYHSGLDAGIPS